MGFFGLPEGYNRVFHEEIFNLCYFSNGGFTFRDVYDLPVIKRKFFLQLLKRTKDDEREAINSKQGTSTSQTPPPTPTRYSDINKTQKKS